MRAVEVRPIADDENVYLHRALGSGSEGRHVPELPVQQSPTDFCSGGGRSAGGYLDVSADDCNSSAVVLLNVVVKAVVEGVPIVAAPPREDEGCVQLGMCLEAGGLWPAHRVQLCGSCSDVESRRPPTMRRYALG